MTAKRKSAFRNGLCFLLAKQLKDTRTDIHDAVWSDRQSDLQIKVQNGHATNDQWLAFLHERLNNETKGTSAYQQAKGTLMNETYNIGSKRLQDRMAAGDATPDDMIAFLRGYQVSMNPGSQKWQDIQATILDLRVRGTTINAAQDPNTLGNGRGGHWVVTVK